MTTGIRGAIVGVAFMTAFAFIGMTGLSEAGAERDLKAVVQKIAGALKTGDNAEAKKMASVAVKDKKLVERINDIMGLFKTRKKGGLGVGVKPLANPAKDGIEITLRDLRREVTASALKQADALETTGYWIAALGELTVAKGWNEKESGMKSQKAWSDHGEELRSLGLGFAKAAASKKPLEIKTAADKLNDNCNRCHSIFKDQ